jgi:hypothetical protein
VATERSAPSPFSPLVFSPEVTEAGATQALREELNEMELPSVDSMEDALLNP